MGARGGDGSRLPARQADDGDVVGIEDLGRALVREHDGRRIRRPVKARDVDVARIQPLRRPLSVAVPGDRDDVQTCQLVVFVDHARVAFFLGGLLFFVGFRRRHDEGDRLPVRRPRERRDRRFLAGHLLSLASCDADQEDVGLVGVPRRQEGDPLPVGRPARRRSGLLAVRQLKRSGAVARRDVDLRQPLALLPLHHRLGDDIGHAGAIRRRDDGPDALHFEQEVRRPLVLGAAAAPARDEGQDAEGDEERAVAHGELLLEN